jgi:hypothetical protein
MPPSDGEDYTRPLRELVDRQVLPLIEWYQRKKRWPRRLHKSAGAAVILLSALIPITSAWSSSTAARVFVGVVGVLITTITGLVASYDWYRRWRIFTIAQSSLESQLTSWEFAITRAQMLPSEEGRAEALAATRDLLDAANQARSEETESFFENQSDKAGLLPGRFEG